MACYGLKMGSKAIQFSEIFSPWTEKSSWTHILVLLACVLTFVVWNGVELTGVHESLFFSCPVPVLSPERLAVAQGLLTPSASKSHYLVILEGSHQPSANQRVPPLWDHTCQLCSQSQETNQKMQQQQVTSAIYRGGKYVKSILILNFHLKSMIQMGLNLFFIKG